MYNNNKLFYKNRYLNFNTIFIYILYYSNMHYFPIKNEKLKGKIKKI